VWLFTHSSKQQNDQNVDPSRNWQLGGKCQEPIPCLVHFDSLLILPYPPVLSDWDAFLFLYLVTVPFIMLLDASAVVGYYIITCRCNVDNGLGCKVIVRCLSVYRVYTVSGTSVCSLVMGSSVGRVYRVFGTSVRSNDLTP
jgi:hypothetical protein